MLENEKFGAPGLGDPKVDEKFEYCVFGCVLKKEGFGVSEFRDCCVLENVKAEASGLKNDE